MSRRFKDRLINIVVAILITTIAIGALQTDILFNKHIEAEAATISKPSSPKSMKLIYTKNKKSILVSWSKVSKAKGYMVQLKNRKGKYTTIKTLKSRSYKISAKTFKRLYGKSIAKNKNYRFRVRAYKLVNRKKVYGAYHYLDIKISNLRKSKTVKHQLKTNKSTSTQKPTLQPKTPTEKTTKETETTYNETTTTSNTTQSTKKPKVTITLNANGGQVERTKICGDVVTLEDLPYAYRSGYEFVSWSVVPSGGFVESYTPHGIPYTFTSDKTLYAVWAKCGEPRVIKEALYELNRYRKGKGLLEIKWADKLEAGTKYRAKELCTYKLFTLDTESHPMTHLNEAPGCVFSAGNALGIEENAAIGAPPVYSITGWSDDPGHNAVLCRYGTDMNLGRCCIGWYNGYMTMFVISEDGYGYFDEFTTLYPRNSQYVY